MNNFDTLDVVIVTLLMGTPLTLAYYLYTHIRKTYWGNEKVSKEKDYVVNVYGKGEG
jgi:hypothetical protein